MPDDVSASGVAPAPDAEAASSADGVPESPQVSETAPPLTSQPEPPQFNMPPAERWEELRQQRLQAEDRAVKAEQLVQLALQKLQTPQGISQPVQDVWAGKIDHPDPATAQYWQIQKAIYDPLEQKVRGLEQAVVAGRGELAEVKIENFRLKNPTIVPNSEDEKAIAVYVAQNYSLEAAKKLALYDKLEAENRALKSKQSAVGSKVSANATGPTSSIPAGAGLPGAPGDWRENVRQAVRKGGSLADIVNATGATPAP